MIRRTGHESSGSTLLSRIKKPTFFFKTRGLKQISLFAKEKGAGNMPTPFFFL
jgi:hypothetical protein